MSLFFAESYDDLAQLLTNQLRDLYDAEHRILEALPKMVEKATSQELKDAFEMHRQETNGHIEMLEKAFNLLGSEPERETCEACKGLIKEGSELLNATGASSVIDAGLILAAQRIEHYEIAGYGGAKALALQLGHDAVADLLDEVLSEEKAADSKLSAIAEGSINSKAAQAQAMPA